MKNQIKNEEGFTLLEIVIYTALLGVISIFLVNFMTQISGAYQIMRAEREVVSNARLVVERMEKTISEAAEIYIPTSKFGIDDGQLSLVVPAPASDLNHGSYYTDFWVTGGKLWMRQEGQGETAISAPSVRVDSFYLEKITQKLNRDSVKMTIKMRYNSPINLAVASTTLNSTITLRGSY